MIKDDDNTSLSLLNNDNCFRIYSVKIEHFLNKIIINNDNSINQSTPFFHQKDGFPMKLSIESFVVILIQCDHKIINEFKIPLESAIDWKIVNGIRDGAFKHGFGANTKYSDDDCDTSVIYYPPNEGIGKRESQPKEIPILIKIKPMYDKEFNNIELLHNTNDVNYIKLNDFENYQLLLTLYLRQKKGFLNRMFYEVSLTVKEIGIDNDFSNLQTYKIKEHNFGSIFKKANPVFQKHTDNCICCSLDMTFKPELESSPNLNNPKIDIETNRLFTSEFIKINSTKSYNRNTNKNGSYPLLCTIKSKDKDICKLRIINCPTISVNQNIWSCTAGSFPCDNKGDCVVYYTPQENELSNPLLLYLCMKKICLIITMKNNQDSSTKRKFGF
jgi:hypothetical protein